MPDHLKDNTFAACLKEDNSTKRWLAQLLKNLEAPPGAAAPAAGGAPGGAAAGAGGIPLPVAPQ